MQDKIQEIMGLVDEIAACNSPVARRMHLVDVKSKLRELVREPLTHELAWAIAVASDSPLDAIRKAEHAHGITSASGEV